MEKRGCQFTIHRKVLLSHRVPEQTLKLFLDKQLNPKAQYSLVAGHSPHQRCQTQYAGQGLGIASDPAQETIC